MQKNSNMGISREWCITLPYACFYISTIGERVTETAPIGKWMKNRRVSEIVAWVQRKGGKIEQLK